MNSFDKIHEIELSENVCLDKFVLEIDEERFTLSAAPVNSLLSILSP